MIARTGTPLSKEQLNNWVKQIADQHTQGTIIVDPSSNTFPILYSNNAFFEMTGYDLGLINGLSLHFFNGTKTSNESIQLLQKSLEKKEPFKLNLIHYKKDGTAFWHQLTCHPMKDSDNVVQFLLIYCENITDANLVKMMSILEREVYGYLENNFALDAIFQLVTQKIEAYYLRDIYCVIHTYQNNGSLDVSGHGALPLRVAQQLADIRKKPIDSYKTDSIYMADLALDEFTCKQFLNEDLKFTITSKWAKPIFSSSQELKGLIVFYFENKVPLNPTDFELLNQLSPLLMLTIKYGEQRSELKRLAYFDSIIDIPNAHYFRTELNDWVNEGSEGVVIVLQPGEYSKIVDLYGRTYGDELLKQIVDRLNKHRNGHDDFIARFSNSAIIIATKMKFKGIRKYDLPIRPLTSFPYFLADEEIFITLKIGISYFGKEISAEDAIRQADLALSNARQNPGTNIAFFEAIINEQLKREMDTLNQLNYGLENDEFTPYLQPKINMKSGRIDGFEALSRWNSHQLGQVSPAIFIPLAEQAGRIKDIDTIVLKKSLSWLSHRIQNGLKVVPVAVNISPNHFYDKNFLRDFKAIVASFDVPLNYLKLELTESIELVDFTRAKQLLSELKQMGIDCSIDDFGVGFSSLSYLPKLPFSEIKIDSSFVSAINDIGMYAVIQTIIQLAINLQMRAVAEGIETLEQYIMLKNMGCHIGQGYFLHKPMPFEVANALLDTLE